MTPDVKTMELLPRFSTFVGTGAGTSVKTRPVDVGRYAAATFVAWRGAAIGTNPALSIQLEQSADLTIWSNLGSVLTPAANDEDTESVTLTQRWLRAKISVTGTSPAVTCWLTGDFTARAR